MEQIEHLDGKLKSREIQFENERGQMIELQNEIEEINQQMFSQQELFQTQQESTTIQISDLQQSKGELALGNEAIKRELEYMEAQLKSAEAETEYLRKHKKELSDLKQRIIRVVELIERRPIDEN